MRRYSTFSMLVAVAALGGSAVVGAQDARVRRQERIVIPHELILELQKLAREAFGEDAFRNLSRELGRAMRDITLELGHYSVRSEGGAAVQDRDFRAEQTDKQTRTLAIGASGALELKNVVGNITVKAGGPREATVEIVRVSRGRTDADAKLGLERVTSEVTTRADGASVHANYPDDRRPPYSVSVSYNVTAPAGTRLNVHSITGDVTITGIKGEMEAFTVAGALEISQAGAIESARTVTGNLTISDVQSDSAIETGTMSGSVRLSNIKAKRLIVGAVAGAISAREIQAAGAEVNCMSGSIEYSGAVSASGRYEFQSHSGEIRLGLTGNFDFEGRSFGGQIDADPALGLKVPAAAGKAGVGRLRQSSLKGTIGTGGAFVEATTFSGQIWIGRKLK